MSQSRVLLCPYVRDPRAFAVSGSSSFFLLRRPLKSGGSHLQHAISTMVVLEVRNVSVSFSRGLDLSVQDGFQPDRTFYVTR